MLKSGSNMFYENGATFINSAVATFPNGFALRSAAGNLFYENGASRFSSSGHSFRYANGTTVMIDGAGDPYFFNGIAAPIPFTDTQVQPASFYYTGLDIDRIARYANSVIGTKTVFVLGGSVDYASINGDYNRDGGVDGADVLAWQRTLGGSFDLSADGSANRQIDGADLDVWTSHFGEPTAVAGATPAVQLAPGESPGANYGASSDAASAARTIDALFAAGDFTPYVSPNFGRDNARLTYRPLARRR